MFSTNIVTSEIFTHVIRGANTKGWVAKITGTDPEYIYARRFCQKDTSKTSGSGRSGKVDFILRGDGLYEFRDISLNSTKTFSGFFVVEGENVKKITRSQVKDYL